MIRYEITMMMMMVVGGGGLNPQVNWNNYNTLDRNSNFLSKTITTHNDLFWKTYNLYQYDITIHKQIFFETLPLESEVLMI